MSISKNKCVINVILDRNIKKLVQYYCNIQQCSISQFCASAIWEKLFKLIQENKNYEIKII